MEWITRDGEKINIDNMSHSHIKNALKMLLKNHVALKIQHEELKRKYNLLKSNPFVMNGDMGEQFNETYYDEEY